MLNRFQIHKCLDQIIQSVNESDLVSGDRLNELFRDYPDAIRTLDDLGCIEVTYYDDVPSVLVLKNHAFSYKLERHEVWVNRIGGFIFGVIATVLAEILSAWILTML